jgi:hypothetical protein
MYPKVKKENDGSLTLSLNVVLSGSSLDQEESLALALNSLGLSATLEVLSSFDKNEVVLEVEGVNLSSKGKKKRRTNALTEK